MNTVRIERTPSLWMAFEPDGPNQDVENLDWHPALTVEMTVENRGAAVRLRRNERLVWGDRIWYGYVTRYVELRVWHDGSISVEAEEDR